MSITIREGDIAEVVDISQRIPEFQDPYSVDEYQKRMDGKVNLILVAEEDGRTAGFKVGYDKYGDGSFYSWMGGVLPDFRKKGVAQQLADEQERWARKNGFTKIRFKTRNYLTSMLLFSIKNGFHIVDVEKWETSINNRILLEKSLAKKNN